MPISQSIVDAVLRSPEGKAAYHAVERLHDAGFEAWWVGGPVRDMLLKFVPEDIDIATDANPDQVAVLFPDADMTKAALGAVLIFFQGRELEVTTFREESEATTGRAPDAVVFTTRENDAKRRDITVNALYYNPISRELFDPFCGEDDLHERLIRFIGDPLVRIDHDPLRILRAIRFRALLDGQYHPDTFHALHTSAKSAERLSGSRQLEELEKMIAGPRPQLAFEDLWETDILECLLPELHRTKGVAQPKDYHREGDVWDHMLKCLTAATDEHGADVRFAAAFHDCGKAETFDVTDRIHFNEHASVSARLAGEALKRLQCNAKRREKIVWLVAHHMMMGDLQAMNDLRKTHWYYHPWFPELLQLFWLDIAGTEPSDFSLYDAIVRDYHAFLDAHPRPPKPLLSGDEIMDILHLKPGEEVGRLLQALHQAQAEHRIQTKAEALKELKRLAAELESK